MKIKDISQTLGGLLDQANRQATGQASTNSGYNGSGFSMGSGNTPFGSPEDSIPDELQDEPIFEINYKKEQQQCINKAKQSIMIIVKEVVPISLLQSALIKDKIKQDSEQLGNLYYQYLKKETYHQGLMDIIARGDHSVKAFDVCEKISRSLEDLGDKITTLQNQLRKYYIDTYLDMQHKDDEDEILMAKAALTSGDDDTPRLINPLPVQTTKLENRVVGTDSVTRNLANLKKAQLMKKNVQTVKTDIVE